MFTKGARMPRWTRAKAMVGTLVTVAALTGGVQAAIPAPAAAMMNRDHCMDLARQMVFWNDLGVSFMFERIATLYRAEGCGAEEEETIIA